MKLLLFLAWAAVPARASDYPLPPPPAVSTAVSHLDFDADHMDYDESSSTLHLRGSVRVRESTWTIKSDELWLDTRRHHGRGAGYLLAEDGVSAVYGDSGEFDYEKHSGTLYRASAGHGDWRIHSKSVRLDESRRLDYYGADFTSCNVYPDPHYHFHSTRLTVVPKKRMIAYNTWFYLGPVPLFYIPILYKSLKPDHFLRFKVQPGYDRRNGAFVKSTLTTSHSPSVYSKLYLDYYGSQGLGTGGELNLHKGTDARGVLYGYQIHEKNTGQERWAILGNGYDALSSSVAVQARMQVQSDSNFNNDYARASTFRVTPELINNGAVVYRTKQSITRFSYSRKDDVSADPTKYLKTTEDYPRLDYQTTQFKVGRLPWLNTATAFADNNFDHTRLFIQKSAGGAWEATRPFALGRGVSFTPKATYGQTYYNRVDAPADNFSTSTVRDVFIGRYRGQATLRVNSAIGAWDVSELYAVRQKADSLTDDAGAPDHGVETNLLTLEDAFRPTRRVLVRAFSGYDFRVFRDRQVGFRDRVQPMVGEVVYSPTSRLSLSARNDYQLDQKERSFIFSGTLGEELGTFLRAGAGYNLAQSDEYFINADFGWAPSSGTWRLVGALRSEAVTPGGFDRLGRYRLFEKELMVTKAWHDFYTRVMVRLRPGGVREINFRVDLRLGSTSKDRAPRRDWEAEWFPERGTGAVDRP